MSKIYRKILVVLLLAIVFISSNSNFINAAYELTKAYIEEIGKAPYHLKYYNEAKGMYTYSICSIVGHYQDGKFYPAYCLNRDLKGVGTVENYTVDIDRVIEDVKVWRAVKNGYPYKTAQEMGLESDFDAFAVTKFAVYCLTGQADINLYIADDDDGEGQAMLRALHNLVDIGLNGNETFSNELKITQTGNFTEDGDYYSLIYKVNAGTTISKYNIDSVSGLSDGDLITDINGNIRTSFNSGENFKVKILKSNLTSDKKINVEVTANLKNYPMFYGRTRIASTQNYLITANSYQNIKSSVETDLKLNTGKIIINKTDDETHEKIEGATFELYNSKNECIATSTTNRRGVIEFKNLYQGNYKLKEIKTNENYVLNENNNYNVNVNYNQASTINIENKHKKGNITVYKVDKDNNNIVLENVGFELYNEETGKSIGTYYTDNNGKIEIDNIRTGNYILKEISTNKWYNITNDRKLDVKWNQNTKLKVENELKKSQIKIIKVDKDNNEIKIPNVVFEVQDVKGNVLETVMTDEKGEALTKEYPVRDYESIRLHEIQTDKNYALNDEITEITLEENNVKTVVLENEKKKGQIKLIKVDLDNNDVKLEGVKFNILDENNNIIETLITNEEGLAVSKMLPIDQIYNVQEIETKENYILSDETKTVTLEENKISNITFENEKKKGQIKVIKVDAENNEVKLSNVEFNVLNEQGEILETLVTDENGEAITRRLPVDESYILQETKTNEKYVLSKEKRTVNVEENKISNIKFENKKIKGTIQVVKKAAEDSAFSGVNKGEPLEGIVFEIYDENNNVVQSIKTDSRGIAKSDKLEKGIYKVKEIETNEWYLLDEKFYTLEIKTNNQTVTLNLENTPGKPEQEIQKTGPNLAKENEEVEYKVNIKNTGNVALENFTWEDEIPTDHIRVTKINTGTYNQKTKYSIYYKTNFSNQYILFLEDISTMQDEEIDFTKELSDNEYITNIKLDFGTVDAGFQNQTDSLIYGKVNANAKRDEVFENKVTLTSKYNNINLKKESSWKTKIYKILPMTGI